MSNIQNQELFTDLNAAESDELNGGHRIFCRLVLVRKIVRIGGRLFIKTVWERRCYKVA